MTSKAGYTVTRLLYMISNNLLQSSTIDTLVGEGFNTFRIPILMERIIPNFMTGSIAVA
jgi:hypothetical protein